jgi:hypothetical protein
MVVLFCARGALPIKPKTSEDLYRGLLWDDLSYGLFSVLSGYGNKYHFTGTLCFSSSSQF